MILLTERLKLEPIQASDADLIFPLMSSAEVMAYWDTAEIDDPDVVDQMIANQAAVTEAGDDFYWTMHTLGDGAFVGCCDLSEVDLRHHRAEIGFMLSPSAWGQGYAREAMESVIAFAAQQHLKRLSARTHVGNVRSEALLTRLGFEDEGMLRGFIDRDGERRDCKLWGLLL